MFGNLASYLLGERSSQSAVCSPFDNEVALGTVVSHDELLCREDEDWLLVDQRKEVLKCGKEDTSHLTVSEKNTGRADQGKRICGKTSSMMTRKISLHITTRGTTSPLENLLIEHPSMSVYRRSIHAEQCSGERSKHTATVTGDRETENGVVPQKGSSPKAKTGQLLTQKAYGSQARDFNTAVPTVPHVRVRKMNVQDLMFNSRYPFEKNCFSGKEIDRMNRYKKISGNHKLRRKDRQYAMVKSNANNNRKTFQRTLC